MEINLLVLTITYVVFNSVFMALICICEILSEISYISLDAPCRVISC